MNTVTQAIGAYARGSLVQAGRLCSERVIHSLNASINYLETGRWFAEHGLEPEFVHTDKGRLFQFAARKMGDAKLLYLEFGVWQGGSMKQWTDYNTNPESHFDGFDSFEGLPEVWNARAGRGAYSARGEIPRIGDPRVTFHKGWFHETLPSYQAPITTSFLQTSTPIYTNRPWTRSPPLPRGYARAHFSTSTSSAIACTRCAHFASFPKYAACATPSSAQHRNARR